MHPGPEPRPVGISETTARVSKSIRIMIVGGRGNRKTPSQNLRERVTGASSRPNDAALSRHDHGLPGIPAPRPRLSGGAPLVSGAPRVAMTGLLVGGSGPGREDCPVSPVLLPPVGFA